MVTHRSIKYRLGLLGCLVYTVVGCAFPFSGITIADAAIDPKINPVPPEIENQPPDHRNAHVHNADMSCCKPCVPTEADADADVAKRPCFREALARKRTLGAGIFDFGIEVAEDRKVPREKIDDAAVDKLWKLCAQVLSPEFLPGKTTDVEWRGFKTYSKDPDVSYFACRWTVGDQTIAVRTGPEVTGGMINLQFTGNERLEIRPTPKGLPPSERNKWECVDKVELLGVFTRLFRFPFKTTDDFVLYGGAGVVEGVLVGGGRITSKYREKGYYLDGADEKNLNWYDEATLFITDSDPQYFCVSVKMHKRHDRD